MGRPRPTAFYRFVGVLTRPLLKLLFRTRWSGREHVPEDGGFVLASNHISNFDPWPLGVGLLPERHVRYMAKSELYWWPLSSFLNGVGAFPIKRGAGDIEALQASVTLCREGYVVGMFPEGTRRKKGLRKKRGPRVHSGAARIALEAGVPLVPVAIRGTDRLSRFGPIRVAYGNPIELDDLRERDLREASQIATERLMDEIGRLEASLG